MKSNSKKYPLPTGEQWSRLPERVQALEQATPVTPYKVFTALLTQSGTSGEQTQDNGELITGVTYVISIDSPGMDFTNIGAPDNNLGTHFIATGTTPKSWGNLSGTGNETISSDPGAPVATVLENTIGNIWFGYTNVGVYSINTNSLFPEYKIYGSISEKGGYDFSIEIGGGGSDSTRQISTYDTGVLTNNLLAFTPIEIRVYN
jgi:hypothetical protein